MEDDATLQVYQLKITLRDVDPPIWRRVLVRSDASLASVHDVVQAVMGWDNYHLHEFVIRGKRYGMSLDDFPGEVAEDSEATLAEVAPSARMKMRYTYDFGDDWRHDIVVEKILPADPQTAYPVCLGGARHAPPEDCGGPWSYQELILLLDEPDCRDPHSERYDERIQFLAEDYDPEAFDLAWADQRLAPLRPRRRRARRPG